MILKYALKKSLKNANEDFRHGNNSSVTSKSPLLPKFENILLLSDKSKIFSNFGNNGDFDVTEQLKTAPV